MRTPKTTTAEQAVKTPEHTPLPTTNAPTEVTTTMTDEMDTTTEAPTTLKTTRKPGVIKKLVDVILTNASSPTELRNHAPMLTNVVNSGGLSQADLVKYFLSK